MHKLKPNKKHDSLEIQFSGDLSVSSDVDVLAIAKQIKDSSKKLKLVLEDYQAFDLSFIQLLLSIKRYAEEVGCQLSAQLNFKQEDQKILEELNLLQFVQNIEK